MAGRATVNCTMHHTKSLNFALRSTSGFTTRVLPTQFNGAASRRIVPDVEKRAALFTAPPTPSAQASASPNGDAPTAATNSNGSHSNFLKYKRVMLKVSGEALEGSGQFGIDPNVLKAIAKEVAEAAKAGVEIAIVVGGGNFFRGVDRWDGLERASADYVGMLATVMNAICLQSALEAEGVATRVQTAIAMQEVAEPYIRRRAIRHLERGRVVIFGAGTGNPFFTTDTAAALRAAEIGADAYFKATKVDGVYDCDPVSNPNAKLHRRLSFRDVVIHDLQVMDETAITLCKENKIPVVVFNLTKPGNILAAVLGDPAVGTRITCDGGDECCVASDKTTDISTINEPASKEAVGAAGGR